MISTQCAGPIAQIGCTLALFPKFNAKCQHDSWLHIYIRYNIYIASAAPIESDSSNIGQIYWHGWALWSLSKSTVSGSLMDQPHHQPTKGGIVKEVLFLFLCSLVLSLDLLLDSGQVIAIKARCCWLGGYGLALMGWCYFSNGWEMVITKQSAYTRSAQVSYLFSKLCTDRYTFFVKSQCS